MKFRVIKSSFDGICGGDAELSLKEALSEISYSKGWDSLEQMRAAVKKWAKNAKPGQVFCCPASCVVATGGVEALECNSVCPECDCDMLDFGDVDWVEDGCGEQQVECPECGTRWMDVFTLTERRDLFKAKKDGGKQLRKRLAKCQEQEG